MLKQVNRKRWIKISSLLLALILLVMALPAAADSPVIIVANNNLNLRVDPDANAPVLSIVPYETALTATAISSDGLWIATAYDGQFGWLALDYVSISAGYLADLPVSGAAATSPVAHISVAPFDRMVDPGGIRKRAVEIHRQHERL